VTTDGVPELSIVLPVYNEADNISAVLHGIGERVRTSHEVLVVYDTDSDTTIPAVRSLGVPTVRLHRNASGRGVLNAMRSGIAASRAPLVLISMADGSDDPAVIDAMVARAKEGADVVAASRYVRGGRQVGGPVLKSLLSRTAGITLHLIAGLPIHDATSNFRLYRRSFLEHVTIESDGGFALAIELTVKAWLGGWKLEEVPTVWRDRTAGTSNFRVRAWLPSYLRWYWRALTGRRVTRPRP